MSFFNAILNPAKENIVLIFSTPDLPMNNIIFLFFIVYVAEFILITIFYSFKMSIGISYFFMDRRLSKMI